MLQEGQGELIYLWVTICPFVKNIKIKPLSFLLEILRGGCLSIPLRCMKPLLYLNTFHVVLSELVFFLRSCCNQSLANEPDAADASGKIFSTSMFTCHHELYKFCKRWCWHDMHDLTRRYQVMWYVVMCHVLNLSCHMRNRTLGHLSLLISDTPPKCLCFVPPVVSQMLHNVTV